MAWDAIRHRMHPDGGDEAEHGMMTAEDRRDDEGGATRTDRGKRRGEGEGNPPLPLSRRRAGAGSSPGHARADATCMLDPGMKGARLRKGMRPPPPQSLPARYSSERNGGGTTGEMMMYLVVREDLKMSAGKIASVLPLLSCNTTRTLCKTQKVPLFTSFQEQFMGMPSPTRPYA